MNRTVDLRGNRIGYHNTELKTCRHVINKNPKQQEPNKTPIRCCGMLECRHQYTMNAISF